ncbi:MAG: DUF1217 domain-containing protein [Pararhodobacter sp.]
MSFQPVLPLGGYAGWLFLQRTLEKQSAAHAAAPAEQRDAAYFRENIGSVQTAADLVQDRRLLRVALTAFGLAEDLPNRAFIQKALESSTLDPASLVNRLTDARYKRLANAFGLGPDMLPQTANPGFADRILSGFHERSFEEAVGEQDQSMRLAMALKRDLGQIAGETSSELTKWYKVLGTPSLRSVFETAYNLPSSFGSLDIDRQVAVLQERTERLTGDDSISQFSRVGPIDSLTRRFFLMGQLAETQASSGQSAVLSLLQSGQASLRSLLGR